VGPEAGEGEEAGRGGVWQGPPRKRGADNAAAPRDVLEGLVQGIVADLRLNSTVSFGYENLVESAQAFVAAVDWSERWIQAVLALHLCLLVIIILARQHFWVQVGLFITMATVGLAADPLNRFLGTHWTAFATQNYFDRNGFFISVFLSIPFICLMLLQLVFILYYAMQLLVTLKHAEANFRRRRNQERERLQRQGEAEYAAAEAEAAAAAAASSASDHAAPVRRRGAAEARDGDATDEGQRHKED
jgi:hypothetical protein